MKPLIVFDLDGTLIDSRQDLAESANELLATYGAPPFPVARVVGMVGEGARVLVQRALEAASLNSVNVDAALHQFLEIYDRHLVAHTRLYPGLAAALASVSARATLALLTNKPAHHTTRILDAFGLKNDFHSVVAGDSGFPRKPDPAGLQHLIRTTGSAPSQTLMVGDSAVDIETGRRAGVRLCVAAYGFAQYRDGLHLAGDELVAATPQDLQARLLDFLGPPLGSQ
ncbi:MAG: HAD-IA family hydrolase [Vicinamibacterales bacterium]